MSPQAVETNWISSAGSFIRDFEAMFCRGLWRDVWRGLCQRHGRHASGAGDAGAGAGRRGDHPHLHDDRHGQRRHLLWARQPVLVDMEPDYWQMDIDQVAEQDHAAHQGHHAGAHLRPSHRHGPADGAGADSTASS